MQQQDFINVTADELRTYMAGHQEDEYILVDVRQPNEYAQGHIPGANFIPLSELPARLAELPVDRDIVFY